MGNILLLFLVLFPIFALCLGVPAAAAGQEIPELADPDHSRSGAGRRTVASAVARGCPGAAGVFGFGLRLQAGSLGSLLALVSAFLWAATGLNCPSYFAAAEGCNRFYFFWLLTLGALMGCFWQRTCSRCSCSLR